MNFSEYENRLLNTKPRFLNEEEKKHRKKCKKRIQYLKDKEYYQDYRDSHKEDIKEYNQDYRYSHKEESQEYYQKNKEKNKEEKKEYKKEYYQKNKEEILEKYQEYYQTNKEELLEYKKEYLKTHDGYKSYKKSHWKRRGLNMDNFEEIFKRYCETTKCDFCNVILTKDKRNTTTTKCMDHDHETGEFRNILCHPCNVRRK